MYDCLGMLLSCGKSAQGCRHNGAVDGAPGYLSRPEASTCMLRSFRSEHKFLERSSTARDIVASFVHE